ncbi:hypothetical protein QAD02_024362 [Eretmocerus hayati]|uniref:Uncharacterized protein n=1 Tax=Eretmocerus hayati TaxID=131215 RepID=A0ACC2PYN0_9HYME|nr:hypothetical protein QAD02_024362 [Eretmocerus hayati]
MPNLLCHSDLWKNNLMFDQSQPVPKCLLVDFQLLRYASPSFDLAKLLYVNTTPEFREKSENQMLKYYHDIFREEILKYDSAALVPTFQTLLEDWQNRRIVGMVDAAIYLPGNYLKKQELEKFMNDPRLLERWLFETRFDLLGKAMDEDPIYKDKIRAVVSELIDGEKRLLSNEGRSYYDRC